MTDSDYAVMELSLAHAVGSSVVRAYDRSTLRRKRRTLMEQWGAFVTEISVYSEYQDGQQTDAIGRV